MPSCSEKIRYPSKREADKELNKLIRKRAVQLGAYGGPDKFEIASYRCPSCGLWHLTSLAQR